MSWLFDLRTALLAITLLTLAAVIFMLWRGLRLRHKAGDAGRIRNAALDSSPETLAEVCAQWTRRTEIPIELRAAPVEVRADVREELLWIVNEALGNVEAHAEARHVTIDLIDRNDMAELHVADNGVGFTVPEHLDPPRQRGHQGLAGMVERAKVAGGSLEIRSTPGGGTRIIAILPTALAAQVAMPSPTRLVTLAVAACGLLLIAGGVAFTGMGRTSTRAVIPMSSAAPVQSAAVSSPEPRMSVSPTSAASATPSVNPSASPSTSASKTTASPTPTAKFPCSVDYVVGNQTKSEFTAYLHITNHRSNSLTGWVLRFSFSNGQQITDYGSGISVTQHGRKVSIAGINKYATLSAGQTIVVSIQGTQGRQNEVPSAFTLDGAACG